MHFKNNNEKLMYCINNNKNEKIARYLKIIINKNFVHIFDNIKILSWYKNVVSLFMCHFKQIKKNQF